ncbi:MAG TPA: glycosyltransferase family 39 protein [Nanoarchaeota archaeon]|nr:glycosyltransferase family 39 protein [Nanoarchaeota archaeon]HIH34063.1 glycosyltransferase family 39 protein [Nanoarchaeota archaeon]HIH51816.1 glycosyltransferase family 39 protein [Nanoarchaeota archaeon]HIH66270.1 glycosyltransferase family 39 protein [Nanoarchaeota archaeon]
MEETENLKVNWGVIALVVVFLLAVAVRLYFFSAYNNQPVWWDESEHLVMAKHIAFETPKTGWNESREILLPLIFSFFFKIFNSEAAVRFLQVIFSLLAVFLTYLVGKEIFDRNIGLIAALGMAVSSELLFWTFRFGLEPLGITLSLSTILFFWKGHIKKGKPYFTILAAVFGALAFMASAKEVLIILAIFFSLILSANFRFLKDKKILVALLIGFVLLTPYMAYYKSATGSFLPRSTATSAALGESLANSQWSWGNFLFFIKYIPSYLQLPWFILFLIGLVIVLINLVLGLDLSIRSKDESWKESGKYLLLVLWILLPLFFFSYPLGIAPGNYGEPRFMLEAMPAIFFVMALGLQKIHESLAKYGKGIAIAFTILVLLLGAFYQLRLADASLKSKETSFLQVKQAGLWIKENSQVSDWVIVASSPQVTYYSERQTQGPPESEEEFLRFVREKKPKFMVLSAFEPHPNWYLEWPASHTSAVKLVQAYSAGQTGQQSAVLVIYELTSYSP